MASRPALAVVAELVALVAAVAAAAAVAVADVDAVVISAWLPPPFSLDSDCGDVA